MSLAISSQPCRPGRPPGRRANRAEDERPWRCPTELKDLAAKVSNRGRWGDDDQRGTLNLIDEAAVLRGVAAARQGRAFSLAIPFDEDGPQTGAIPGRDNPAREMLAVNTSVHRRSRPTSAPATTS